jgi:excisionase family DNA binding protein
MTLKEAAVRLGLSPGTLQIQIAKHKLRAKKIGRDWSVTPREVARYRAESLGQALGGRPRKPTRIRRAPREALQDRQAGTSESSVPPSDQGTA